MRGALLGAIAYGLAAIATFGPAAVASQPKWDAEFARCSRPGAMCVPIDGAVPPPAAALTGAILWPLWWSWELAERAR